MNKKELISELKKLNIEITDIQFKQIDDFCMFLLSENKKYNLTAIKEIDDVLLKHVYDSLTLCQATDLNEHNTLLDIGSGAGFPGIIIKIVFPHLQVTLLDSNNKKTTFLTKAKDLLKLEGLNIVHDRAESYIKNQRETYDLVTARAVASLNVLIELAIPFLKIKGLFIAMKANIDKELQEGKTTAHVLGAKIIREVDLTLPIENSKRSLIIVEKQTKTSLEYPRAYDRIIKKPL